MQISLGRGTFVPLRLPHLATPLQTNKHKQSLTGKADITIDIYIYFTFSAVSVFFLYIDKFNRGGTFTLDSKQFIQCYLQQGCH